MLFDVGGSCRSLYSIVSYLYVGCSGSISSVGKRELICLLSFTCNYVVSVRRGGAWDGLCYFIVALPGPSIQLFFKAVLTHGSLCCLILTSVSVLPSPFVRADGINFGYGRRVTTF